MVRIISDGEPVDPPEDPYTNIENIEPAAKQNS